MVTFVSLEVNVKAPSDFTKDCILLKMNENLPE